MRGERARAQPPHPPLPPSLWISTDFQWIWVDFLHVDLHLYIFIIYKAFPESFRLILSRLVVKKLWMFVWGCCWVMFLILFEHVENLIFSMVLRSPSKINAE